MDILAVLQQRKLQFFSRTGEGFSAQSSKQHVNSEEYGL
jgi:hypothetical protein